uniref:CSON011050 protein n=1 Tax=Culicoides sonorensis TaxID=179676 RepID=A0A336MEY3_CULSO
MFFFLVSGTLAKQIKGGYLLRYKRQLFWNTWSEEYVVLYDDSTMAWFTEPGKSSPNGKVLIKESPEMLAISNWTSQIPSRPLLPEGCHLSQLIALGSRRRKSKVYWMLAKSEQEVSDWIAAIAKTLPPPPTIELVVDKRHLLGILKRPIVRVRPSTTAENAERKKATAQQNNIYSIESAVKTQTPVAILRRNSVTSDQKGTLACALPWGFGYGWSTLSNGIWGGALTWSQADDALALHAVPTTHCSNLTEMSCVDGTVVADCYHHPHTDYENSGSGGSGGHADWHNQYDDLTVDDADYAMDFGDFMF